MGLGGWLQTAGRESWEAGRCPLDTEGSKELDLLKWHSFDVQPGIFLSPVPGFSKSQIPFLSKIR